MKLVRVILIIAGAVRACFRGIGRWLESIATDVFGLAGTGLVSYGCWQIYHPSGFIAGGALLILMMLLGQLRNR